MDSLIWHLASQTAETQFIYNLFHLLLAGLSLLVLLYQRRTSGLEAEEKPDSSLPLGFSLLVLHFAILGVRYGAEFFFNARFNWLVVDGLSHALLACGLLLLVSALVQPDGKLRKWPHRGCVAVLALALANGFIDSPQIPSRGGSQPLLLLLIDVIALVGVVLALRRLLQAGAETHRSSLVAMASLGLVFFLHCLPFPLTPWVQIVLWNVEQFLFSVSLFAFAWSIGEHSSNLFDRVFVRLNLTFIILASLIMLITVGMEKYQYLRLAEERSIELAEFLRGHITYYRAQGEDLEAIFRHPEVLRRVVVEFGNLPELREVNVYLDGQRATFRYSQDRTVKEEIVPWNRPSSLVRLLSLVNMFPMVRLPVSGEGNEAGRIEFIGTMDYINQYIGRYIIVIYFLFTLMVGLASGIIGMIVTNADRRLRRQYAELQETQDRLGQAAKLASVGQLAGGMAHEINNPITSILSLSSHLAGEEQAAVTPRFRKNLELISQQAERVSRIVGNLLMFARQSQLDLKPTHPAEVLETALTLVQFRLREARMKLVRKFNRSLPPILGDPGQLTEVFVNLFNNAIDAMPTGGTLTVRAVEENGPEESVRFEIEDTGPGISPDQLPRIFDPFFTTKEPGCGTGLGLSICHGIIKDHGGQIWAQRNPGRGTTFVITLPPNEEQTNGEESS